MVSVPQVGFDRPFNERLKASSPNNVPVELVCITDGSVIECIDEGPHPVMDGKAFPQWSTTSPSQGRQRILALLRKRDAAGNPLFYATKPGVRVWDKDISRFVDAPTITPELKPVQDAHAAIRADRARHGEKLMEAEKKKQQAQAEATEQVVIGALAKVLGKASADKPAKGKDGAA